MDEIVEHDRLDSALKQCGVTWDAAQAHGLLTGCLAVGGVSAGPGWLQQVLEGADTSAAAMTDCRAMLDALYQATFWQLSERLSEFEPLLPDDQSDAQDRTLAMAHWCEGFLHGVVSARHSAALRERLAAEPLADIVRDLLQVTRAEVDADADQETNEAAYAELVEYLRVAAQLVYEELAEIRHSSPPAQDEPDTMH